MIEVILDASQLEVFEKCPRSWYYSYKRHIQPKRRRKAFDDGSYWHELLAHYYGNPNKLTTFEERLKDVLEFGNREDLRAAFNITAEQRTFHLTRFREYLYKYSFIDDGMKVIAVEQGFSYLLFEDTSRRFILEGKIDLVAELPSFGLCVIDHKTQSRFYEKYPVNHQVLNYCTFVKPQYFIYNYIGLQDSIGKNTFNRVIYKPPLDILEAWKIEVMDTFQLMYDLLKRAEPHQGYEMLMPESYWPRRRAACTTQFGVCQFSTLCSVPDGSKWVPAVETHYEEKPEKWRAWS